jgi:hypothetical protein
MDSRSFIGGLAMISLTANAAGGTSRPFYLAEMRNELGPNRKLTDGDLTTINGKKEQLVGKIQERYGIAKDAAEKQVDEFTRSHTSDDSAKAAKSLESAR